MRRSIKRALVGSAIILKKSIVHENNFLRRSSLTNGRNVVFLMAADRVTRLHHCLPGASYEIHFTLLG